MSLRPEDLPQDVESLQALVLSQAVRIEALEISLKTLTGMIFGSRSERASAVLDNQMLLDLDDLSSVAPPAAANDDEADQNRKPARQSSKRNVGQLPKWLARVDRILEPHDKACPCCAGELHKIAEDVSESLDIIPPVLRVLRLIRPRYACRACTNGVVQAPAPPRALTGGMASTRMMAYVAVSRFSWNLPLNRQTEMFKGMGIQLDRSTLSRWMTSVAWWVRPLYDRQLQIMHSHLRIFCDETRMPVMKKGKSGLHLEQFWAHATDDSGWNGPAPCCVAFIHSSGRGHKEIREQLADYHGLVQVDGYGGYNGLTIAGRKPGPIELAYCLAHARRKFTDIHKMTASAFSADIIARFRQVYAIEARIRGQNACRRRIVRQVETAPVMQALKVALEAELALVSSQSKTANAIAYVLGHWSGLTLFLSDGRLEVDNNTVERNMRTVAIGRRNSLFAGSEGGAETWAIIASLLATCRLNGVDPFTWLNDALEKMVSGAVKSQDLDQLLPWNWRPAEHRAMPLAA